MTDTPKSLREVRNRAARRAHLQENHMRELTAFVDRIRRERGCGEKVPYFDPADGGIGAECLFVLEAPGPKAVVSGFVSRDNPDETAKNWLELLAEAGVPRDRSVLWNIVPWYVGSGGRTRPANSTDIDGGWPYLLQLFGLLHRLRVVVLVGRKAQSVTSRTRAARQDVTLLTCPHPSPLFVNRRPGNRGVLLTALQEVAAALCPAGEGQFP